MRAPLPKRHWRVQAIESKAWRIVRLSPLGHGWSPAESLGDAPQGRRFSRTVVTDPVTLALVDSATFLVHPIVPVGDQLQGESSEAPLSADSVFESLRARAVMGR